MIKKWFCGDSDQWPKAVVHDVLWEKDSTKSQLNTNSSLWSMRNKSNSQSEG
jgi:hypothetical protein